MLGHSHALSGLAVGAATLPWAPVEGGVAQVAWVAAVGGFAMLPDLDHSGSTVSDMWGPVTDVPSGAIGRLAGGHRWGTHDALLAPLAFGAVALAAASLYWSSLLVVALAIGLALRALHFVIPGRAENTVVGNLVLSFAAAWLLLEHSPHPTWLPWAVALGVLTHVAGDLVTTQGVPVPVLWLLRRRRLALTPMRTGTTLEKAVLAPLFLGVALWFCYANTGARSALDPYLQALMDLG
ncbi:LexA-binding, inner membrane-associated putative hydrolase [Geodermatophilus dictyosporus]|uniref:LexA-binding, inner membrane-associated putative hydrolase n=1 Tax=Geodermatophilus dictyosporus TaxID=1523247 RepID=A0A1I5L1W8_9ACTN|nr:metal-dependent hydrolase [Geodermatophilus dictyosporus]SFO90751.1 LexA-binding, inner membrane-associated putative hydrolase [Geodermatophilus dictyosporus]